MNTPLSLTPLFDIPDGKMVGHKLDTLTVLREQSTFSEHWRRLMKQYQDSPPRVIKSTVLPKIIKSWHVSWNEKLLKLTPSMVLANRYLDELEMLDKALGANHDH